MLKNKKIKQAFTLFEVLIALAILSIAMVAGMMTTDAALNGTLSIEKKALAHWVAMNVINSMELKLLKNKLGEADSLSDSGDTIIRNQNFYWEMRIEKQNIDSTNLLNIQVSVYESQSGIKNMAIPINTVSRNVFVY